MTDPKEKQEENLPQGPCLPDPLKGEEPEQEEENAEELEPAEENTD